MIGSRKLVGLTIVVVGATMVSVVGLLLKVDPVGLAALIATFGTLYLYFCGGSIGEWKYRSADNSSIAEQINAQKSPKEATT